MANSTIYLQHRKDKSGNICRTTKLIRRTPTQTELKARIHYDPETGEFTNLQTRGKAKIGTIAGSDGANGYREIRILNRLFPAHRLAWLYMTGELPQQPISVDHINGIRSDNRWCNLRLATYEQQSWNATVHHHNQSGLKGAWPCKATGRWQSIIQDGKRRIWLGRFDTAQEAHEAWAKKAVEIRGLEWVTRAIGA